MKVQLFLLFSVLNFSSLAQDPLTFDELGSDPSYCRLYSYQNGGGVVYAAATGGVPDYIYEWRELATGATAGSTVWGGRNPGLYEITVTDADGTILKDTVLVDSLNPVADFDITSDDLTIDTFEGDAPAEVTFTNESINFVNPFDPFPDTTFFFRINQFEPWEIYTTYPLLETHTYNFGGTNVATLVAINKNGCTDTTSVTITISGPAGIAETGSHELIAVYSHSLTKTITIKTTAVENHSLFFKLYTLSGTLVYEGNISAEQSEIQLDIAEGVYVYDIIDKPSYISKASGKLKF